MTAVIKMKIGDDVKMNELTLVLLNASLRDNEYPEEEMKPENNKSLTAKYATKELFEELKDLKTANGFTFAQCINTGVKNPKSIVGCHAGDMESYRLYGKFFNAIINDYHNFNVDNNKHPHAKMDANKLVHKLDDNVKSLILSSRIRCARNLDGFNLAPGQKSVDEKKAIENVFIKVFEHINNSDNPKYKDFKGQYYGLYDISEDERQSFIKDHFLFKGNDKMQADSGYHKWFPQARGIYFNEKKTFLCWINEGDHLRLISMETGGDIHSTYNRLAQACNIFEEIIVNEGLAKGFLRDDRFGYVTCCPTNLGTGLRGSVHIKLEKLSEQSLDDLNKIALEYHCQVRGLYGEHSESKGGILDISNKYRLGYTENELVDMMIKGVNKFAEMNYKAGFKQSPPAKQTRFCRLL